MMMMLMIVMMMAMAMATYLSLTNNNLSGVVLLSSVLLFFVVVFVVSVVFVTYDCILFLLHLAQIRPAISLPHALKRTLKLALSLLVFHLQVVLATDTATPHQTSQTTKQLETRETAEAAAISTDAIEHIYTPGDNVFRQAAFGTNVSLLQVDTAIESATSLVHCKASSHTAHAARQRVNAIHHHPHLGTSVT